ncbi:alpha/beta hydrolase [Caulobacter sp. SSI4214]|uniref:alpha/beta fold hydrolase n=1 Tax=Caulobacter sp. SSI4214 TaxID=2575739 RepID=UPI00143C6C55|nr:alpha/beta hydrolase [Caulobacter sp. SSI4214]
MPQPDGRPVQSFDQKNALLEAHAARVNGAGDPALVLLHGFGTDQTIWGALTPRLPPARRIVLYDHMGSGASNLAHYDPARYATLEGYADDLADILEALDLRDATMVAHSVSGMIALLASLRTDRIGRLIMIGASSRYLNDGDYEGGFERGDVEQLLDLMALDFQGWARTLAPQVMDQPEQPGLIQELVYSFSRSNPEITRGFARATFMSDHRSALGACRVPTLVLQASADMVVPLAAARFLANGIPNARLEIMATRGHYPHLSAPDLVAEAIARFLAETQA